MAEETRAEGNISGDIYLKYFSAGCSPLVLMVIVLLSVIAEVRQTVLWLTAWCLASVCGFMLGTQYL